ncbi:MAG: lamin tail domain-containing protein, partial [Pseudomonadota bacterium]
TRATRLEIVDNRHERADDRRAVGQHFVTIRNDGDQPVALADFQLLDRAGQRYRFAKRVLRPGAVIRVHLGRGTDSDSDVYWSGRPSAWDPIYLVDPKGILVAELAMRRRRVR